MVYPVQRTWDFVPGQHQVVSSLLTADECVRIIALHQTLKTQEMVSRNSTGSYRNTDVFWLSGNEPAYAWIFKKLTEATQKFNESTYQFEIDSCSNLQLGRYGPNQHYEWHSDLGRDGYSRRKLSLSVLLSSPDDYAGGELEFGVDVYKTRVTPAQGDAVYFPSWAPHRVVPVSQGERWSLVAWWLGPPFR